jgi:hypothetical protein
MKWYRAVLYGRRSVPATMFPFGIEVGPISMQEISGNLVRITTFGSLRGGKIET